MEEALEQGARSKQDNLNKGLGKRQDLNRGGQNEELGVGIEEIFRK